MTDQSLSKLFEEMRAADATKKRLNEKRDQIRKLQNLIEHREKANFRRASILRKTLHLHIFEGMTVLAAKMAAPDIVDDELKIKHKNAGGLIAGSIMANRITVGSVGSELIPLRKPTHWQRILHWIFKKLGGAA